ncbi:hypothetical protein EJP69_19825 [Variovorax gossypii]|uniref:Adhesin n=1 Tax=Variovorax gossypii TaxID=1679495 RepID=A0A3S0GVN0_9BURK|nr:ESPR-type extended signal peptide-containing protein [Variovorax gossypii]RTQ32948.1 hypothetical protein EJP69_19825 [Variovorax gossypii]
MNRIYRSVWSEALGAFVAAAETTRSRGARGSARSTLVAATAVLCGTGAAWAGLSVNGGSMCMSQGGPSQTWTCQVPNNSGGFAIIKGLPDDGTGASPNWPAVANAAAAALGSGALLFGNTATAATGAGSTAIGNGAKATQSNTLALGTGASANQSNALAIGTGATATNAQALAIGASAAARGTGDVMIGWQAGLSAAAGNRDNVAVGARAGQNINGVQNAYLGNDAGLSVTGGANTGIGTQAGRRVQGSNNTGIGVNSSMDVIGSNNTGLGGYAGWMVTGQGNTAIGMFSGFTVNGDSNTAFGDNAGQNITGNNNVAMGTQAGNNVNANGTVSIGNRATASKDSSIAIGDGATASGTQSISIGTGNNVRGNNSGAIGDPSIIDGANSYSVGNNNSIGSGANNTFVLGNGVNIQVTNATALGNATGVTVANGVALGSNSVASTAAGIVGYDPSTGTTAAAGTNIARTASTLGAVSIGDAANGVYRQITGVAAGTALSDAVNVAQLQAVATQAVAASNKWITGSQTTSYSAPVATGSESTAVGSGAVVNANNSVAVGTGATATTDNSVALGNGSTTTTATPTASVTIQGQTYNFAGANPAGVVSVGSAGAERQIQNVAAGQLSATSTDAVNGSQLYATNQAINNIQTGGGIKYFHANSQAADSQAAGAESVAVGPQAIALGASAIATGNGAQANGAGSIALGANAIATSSNGAAIGAGATADRAGMNGQKELFSNVSVLSTQGGVSVGSTGNERQITNVAGGTQATDAVNVRQLQAVQQSAVRYDTNVDGTVNHNSVTLGNGGSTGPVTVHNVAPGVAPTDAVNVQQLNQANAANAAYTDARVNLMGKTINEIGKKAYAGVAAAMAMESAPYVPGKLTYAAGMGYYEQQAAMGVSLRKTADNGRWSVTGGASATSRGTVAFRVGIGGVWD